MSQKKGLIAQSRFSFLQSSWIKFSLLTGLLIFFAVLAVWGVLRLRARDTLSQAHSSFITELEEKGRVIARLVSYLNVPKYYRDGQKRGDYKDLQTMIAHARSKDQERIAYIFIKDEEGTVVAQIPAGVTDGSTPAGQLSAVNLIPEGLIVSHDVFDLSLPNGTKYTVMDTAIPVIGDRGELHVGMRIKNTIPSGFQTWETWGIAGIFILLAILLLRPIISSQILTPIDQLIHYIKQVGQGNMEHTLTLHTNNEMTILGDHLQNMTEQLKGMVQTEADINRMQGQIMNMLSTVSAAADGNLTVEAEVTADALGSLADAFNMMVASLASLVDQVRNSASDMSLATNDILHASDQMIKGAEEQQNHIHNITSAVDEIAVSMKQVANNAEAAARASQKATEAAQKGESSVEETIRGMHRIRNTVQVTSKKIKSLGDRSIEITEIITTIDDIARQTTILALNAAIEAARAGEHGRGFGVVAEEVRKLAERSSTATQDIADLIKGIQVETNEAVRTMEEGTREVEEGTRLADIAGSSLKEIDKSVGQVANLIQEISLAAKQQARGTDGVVRSMETISDITTQYGEGVRKTTKTIQQLALLSDRLVEAIGNFKISESSANISMAKPKSLSSQSDQLKSLAEPATQAAEPQLNPQSELQPTMPPFEKPQETKPSPQDLAAFTRQFGDDDDDDELITEEDFFSAS
ncbi:hypothetical protein CSA56_09725 [candidate division KSB3 bacterium]|uniref:Chemotaxis protein n=1 Tax=candidate division KSB3 bacterium TaxID=2044937 RepID=A0A2G6KDN4_9BACT|nr:MAG: hypothetical protein CSA56_09725 [candidate division KSB3 bacterium]